MKCQGNWKIYIKTIYFNFEALRDIKQFHLEDNVVRSNLPSKHFERKFRIEKIESAPQVFELYQVKRSFRMVKNNSPSFITFTFL